MPRQTYEGPRYARASLRMWTDSFFRGLSPLKPSGQALWIRLILGPEQSRIPGIIVTGQAALAEALEWSLEDLRRCFDELTKDTGADPRVLVDWPARLVYLPNAVRHREPSTPNIILSWRREWDEVPECGLKGRVWSDLRDHFKSRGRAFSEAFAELGKPSGIPSGIECGNIKIKITSTTKRVTTSGVVSGDHGSNVSLLSLTPPGSTDMNDDVIGRLIEFLAKESGTAFDPKGKNARKLVKARLDDGYTAKQVAQVIRHKCREWRRDDRMRKFCRPDTLFRGSKFEVYLAEARTAGVSDAIGSPTPRANGRTGGLSSEGAKSSPSANGEATGRSVEEARADKESWAKGILADPGSTEHERATARRMLDGAP